MTGYYHNIGSNMRYRLLLFSLLAVAISLPVAAQTFSPNIRVNDDGAGRQQMSPQVRVDRQGRIYVVWSDFRTNTEGDIYISSSTDGGMTFSPNRPAYSGGAAISGMQRGVQFAIDSRGWLHLVWLEQKGDMDLFYSRSTDMGATFTAPVRLSGDSAKHSQDFPSIAIDSSDNIYIAFIDNRDLMNGLSKAAQLYFTKSTDGGSSFSQPVRASNMAGGVGGSCECCNTSIAATGNGHVYISFRSDINNRRDIFIARSLNGGASFDTAIPAASEEWIIPACPMTGSTIALDREETAHVMWRDLRPSANGQKYVYYTTLRFGDTVCAPDIVISDIKSEFPSLSITPDGAILSAYQHNRNGTNTVVYRYSFDGGNSFTMEATPSDEISNRKRELVSTAVGPNGARYAVWQDSRRDVSDIYFSRDTSSPALISPGVAQPIAPQNGAQLPSPQPFVWSSPFINIIAPRNVVYDLTYETGGKRTEVHNIHNTTYSAALEPGDYRWWISARTLIGTSPSSDTMTFSVLGSSGVREDAIAESAVVCRPNPVSGDERVTVTFMVPEGASSSTAILTLNDLTGREVMRLPVELHQPGREEVVVATSGLASGIYNLVLHQGVRMQTTQLVVVR
jgi:hypothetical protein